MYSALEWLLGAGIVTVLLTQIITIARSVIGSLITRSRARKGLLRLLYTEVAQNKVNADYVAPLLDQPDTAKGVLAMRGRYVSAEAWKASRVDLAQNISSKHFAVLSDYYKNVLLLDEVVTVERAKKDCEYCDHGVRDVLPVRSDPKKRGLRAFPLIRRPFGRASRRHRSELHVTS